jgi:hypothetical protein
MSRTALEGITKRVRNSTATNNKELNMQRTLSRKDVKTSAVKSVV